jgi:hypothetical protein
MTHYAEKYSYIAGLSCQNKYEDFSAVGIKFYFKQEDHGLFHVA